MKTRINFLRKFAVMAVAVPFLAGNVQAQNEEGVTQEIDVAPVKTIIDTVIIREIVRDTVIVNEIVVIRDTVKAEAERRFNTRFGGDITLRPYYGIMWGRTEQRIDDFSTTTNYNDPVGRFLTEYGWNFRVGFDFTDKGSFDLRFSNPDGYQLNRLVLREASAKEWATLEDGLPILPNAYFTWRINDVFSFKGGLLEILGSTALDFVAGYERGEMELYTNYQNWGTLYNNSQAGVRFEFDISDRFALNFTGAFPTNEKNIGDNDFRLILDADIGRTGILTLSPMVHSRIKHRNFNDQSQNDDRLRNSVLWAYGLDTKLAINESVNIDLGTAMGHITEERNQKSEIWGNRRHPGSFEPIFSPEDALRKSLVSGVLVRIAPSFSFVVNQLAFSYGLGFSRDRTIDEAIRVSDRVVAANLGTYSDFLGEWNFRLNEYVKFGPFLSWAADITGSRIRSEIDGRRDDIEGGTKNINNDINFGLRFFARF